MTGVLVVSCVYQMLMCMQSSRTMSVKWPSNIFLGSTITEDKERLLIELRDHCEFWLES